MSFLERNKKVLEKILKEAPEPQKIANAAKRWIGNKDPFGAESPFLKEGGFNYHKAYTKLQERMSEADASSAFQQVLRAGVQTIVNQSYQTTATTFESWVKAVPSSKAQESYAPLHGLSFPQEIGPSEVYPEVGAQGLSIQLTNRKYGSMYPVELELLEDDQTGQFNQQAGLLGEYMKLLTEVLVYAKLASKANMQYLNFKIPASETKPANETAAYPWAPASAPLLGGGYNRPGTYLALSQSAIQDGIQNLMGQKNLLGIIMNVTPNRLLHSPKYNFDSAILANSAYYPSGAAAAGSTGGAFAVNPLKGVYDVSVVRYMFNSTGSVDPQSKAWYLVDDTKPFFVLQMREASTVIQEAPNSGKSFELDQIRFKVRGRMNADFIDPRFAWQGNDGSV